MILKQGCYAFRDSLEERLMTIWKCEWCGKSFELGPPSVDRYCSPKCFKESGAKEASLLRAKRIVAERRAEEEAKEARRKREEERWNSLSKEEQEAEKEAKRKEEEAKRQKEEEEQKNDVLIGGVVLAFMIGIMIIVGFVSNQ